MRSGNSPSIEAAILIKTDLHPTRPGVTRPSVYIKKKRTHIHTQNSSPLLSFSTPFFHHRDFSISIFTIPLSRRHLPHLLLLLAIILHTTAVSAISTIATAPNSAFAAASSATTTSAAVVSETGVISSSPGRISTEYLDIMLEYTKQVLNLGTTLFQILSETLGLKVDHLIDMKCAERLALMMHYYPECPQPELTLGTSQHAHSDFLTVLLNDQVSGLQVLYYNQWVDVPFVPGALVVNIGDLL